MQPSQVTLDWRFFMQTPHIWPLGEKSQTSWYLPCLYSILWDYDISDNCERGNLFRIRFLLCVTWYSGISFWSGISPQDCAVGISFLILEDGTSFPTQFSQSRTNINIVISQWFVFTEKTWFVTFITAWRKRSCSQVSTMFFSLGSTGHFNSFVEWAKN